MKVTKAILEQRVKDLEQQLDGSHDKCKEFYEQLQSQKQLYSNAMLDILGAREKRRKGYVHMYHKLKEDELIIVTKETLGFLLGIEDD